jgi:hypothetical protein
MYSHKRSFTGQSTRSLASLFDLPFLSAAVVVNLLFSCIHSFVTYAKLHQHIRNLPTTMQSISTETLASALKYTAIAFNPLHITSLFLGLTLPLILISAAVRFALAPLRVSVQRTAASCYLVVFYLCCVLAVALQQPEWTPGNILLMLARPFGKEFFESLRAILCLSLIAATAVTLARNATSKANRRIRIVSFVVLTVLALSAEHLITEDKRRINSAFLKNPSSVKFIYVIPDLVKSDVQKAFEAKSLEKLKEQLTSFQEIEASTSSYAGQFATTFLGDEPLSHGIRNDQFGEDTRLNVMAALSQRALQYAGTLYMATIGGTTSVARLFAPETPGQRCDSDLKQLAAIGQFQASVLPYSLLPRILDRTFHPELACSTRFINTEQHLLNLHQKIAVELHQPGQKTFVIWISENLSKKLPNPSMLSTENTASLASVLLSMHTEFLELTGLKNFHQTYVVGLAGPNSGKTVFARFDGQANSKLTDLTLEFPGLRSQASTSLLFRPDEAVVSPESSFFYSEVNSNEEFVPASSITPKVEFVPGTRTVRTFVDHSELRAALTNGQRHVICKNVVGAGGDGLSMVKVTLTTHPASSRLPQLTYQPTPILKPTALTLQTSLADCLETARSQLISSLYEDISLRDSSAFRTLLAGLPVQPIQAHTTNLNSQDNVEPEIDAATSALPAHSAEDMEF